MKAGNVNVGGGAGEGSWSDSYQALTKAVFEKDDRPIILYDGICNLCNGGIAPEM
jgi:hypothetical protein